MPTLKDLKKEAMEKKIKGRSKMNKAALLTILGYSKPIPKPRRKPIPPKRTTSLPKKKIGQGTFGKVYLVGTGKNQFVLKEINVKSSFQKSEIEKEISILKKIGCTKYIACIINDEKTYFDSKKRKYFIAMKYIKGQNIGDFMMDQKHFISRQQYSTLVDDLKKGLKFIHDNGIAHKDITPNNIMIDPSTLEIKYIDFGMSCNTDICIWGGNSKFMHPIVLQKEKTKEPLTLKEAQMSDRYGLDQIIDFFANLSVK